jgi:hypothetical protein
MSSTVDNKKLLVSSDVRELKEPTRKIMIQMTMGLFGFAF